MARIRGRKEFADQRQRSLVASSRLLAASGVACDYQCSTVSLEISGIGSLFGDFPRTSQAYAVWMNDPPEAFAIGAPPQIGPRVDSPCDCLGKKVWRAEWQNPAQHARYVDIVDRAGRLADPAPLPYILPIGGGAPN